MNKNCESVEHANRAERIRDHVIVGAGPAGLQLAYLLEQAGRDYLVIESSPRVGSFFRTFPRHRNRGLRGKQAADVTRGSQKGGGPGRIAV